MKKVVVCFLLLLPLHALCQISQELFNKRVTFILPEGLVPAGDLKENDVYNFADEKRTVKFFVRLSDDVVDDNGIPSYTDEAISAVKKEEQWKIFDDGISLNAGKNIGYIKYRTGPLKPGLFEYVFYGSLNNKLLTFYFSCKEEVRPEWEKKMDMLVAKLLIKDIE